MAKAFQVPDVPKGYNLDVVVMPNGEVICLGKTLGWVTTLGRFLSEKS